VSTGTGKGKGTEACRNIPRRTFNPARGLQESAEQGGSGGGGQRAREVLEGVIYREGKVRNQSALNKRVVLGKTGPEKFNVTKEKSRKLAKTKWPTSLAHLVGEGGTSS